MGRTGLVRMSRRMRAVARGWRCGRLFRYTVVGVTVLAMTLPLSLPAPAQQPPPPAPAQPPAPPARGQQAAAPPADSPAPFKPEELDQIVAPVALYPDPL